VRRLVLACLSVLFAAAANAEEAAPDSFLEGWQFQLAPHMWFAGLDGRAEAKNHSADIDVSFADIWDNLDVGVLSNLEARRDKLSVVTNVIYLKLSPSAGHPVGSLLPLAPDGAFSVRNTTEEMIVELRPLYEVLSLPLFGAGDERRIALDLGPGGRMFWLDTHLHIELEPGAPLGPFSRRFDERTIWVDLLGVARVRAQLTENLALVVSGDYGGFDIGSSAHRTWSLGAHGIYRLGEHWDLVAGWRTLAVERGGVDLDMAGPLLGAAYRF
jgi:hypothetical protein